MRRGEERADVRNQEMKRKKNRRKQTEGKIGEYKIQKWPEDTAGSQAIWARAVGYINFWFS
jgi:rhamnogalacturonyl hydrolase YesR